MINVSREQIEKLSNSFDGIFEAKKNNQTLSQKIYRVLLCMLLDHTINPGTLINRREVADLFGTSIAPALEAMLQLESEGYLLTIPRKGTIVRTFSAKDLYENYIVRQAIECQAARFYCGEKIIQNMDLLMPLAIKTDQSLKIYSDENWIDEFKFHSALIKLSNCDKLLELFNKHYQIGAFYSAFSGFYKADSITGIKYDKHQLLLEKLTTTDPNEAEQYVRYHIDTTITRFKQIENKNLK